MSDREELAKLLLFLDGIASERIYHGGYWEDIPSDLMAEYTAYADRLLPFMQAKVDAARNAEHNELSEYVHSELDKYGIPREDNEGVLPEGTRIKRAVDAAVALVGRCGRCGELGHTELAHEPEMKEAIAAAVAAERERCAKAICRLCREPEWTLVGARHYHGRTGGSRDCRAAAIREGEKPCE